MASVTLNGVTYTDDANAVTGLANGGHRVRFVPCLSNFLIEAGIQIALATAQATNAANSATAAGSSATAAADSAASALNAPGTSATSVTSLTIGLGNQALTIQTGKAWAVGQPVMIAYTTDPTQWMHGVIAAYNSVTGALTVNCAIKAGAGTYASWSVALAGPYGAQITDLGVGTLAAGQRLRRVGTALVGAVPEIYINATVKTANYAAVAGDNYPQNTSGGVFTVTLPATPAVGDDPILIKDLAGTFATNTLGLDPGDNKVHGSTGIFYVDINNFGDWIIWSGATYGWVFI